MTGGSLLVLSGAPGSGKTTVAALVADRFERGVHLVGDEHWRSIRSGFVEPHLPEAHEQNILVARSLGAAAAEYAAGGFGVVLDTIVLPWSLPLVIERSVSLGVEAHYLVLRPPLAVALERACARDAAELPEPAVVEQMWRALGDLGRYEGHGLDTCDLSIGATVDAVWARLHDRSTLVS
jgi:cytidylate kinase